MITSRSAAPSAAAIDLGLGGMGDALKQQMDQMEIERKKKLLQQSGVASPPGAGLAASVLFPGTGGFGGI